MNFLEAVRLMKDGKTVRRKAASEGYYTIIKDGEFKNHCGGVSYYSCNLLPQDVLALDWDVVEETDIKSMKWRVKRVLL